MEQLFADLKSLIEIPSVNQPAEPNKPFGAAIDQALDQMLTICQREGFQVYKDPEGYYGYAQLGEGEGLFGVLCHLDVVPAGTLNEWYNPPFQMVKDDVAVYGRGVQDDKGPTIIALHALVDLVKQGYQLDRPVRFIFGTDEENGWGCINQYLADQQEIPVMGIAPDGSFPLTYAEKGLWQVELIREGHDEIEFKGGVAFNVVPGEAIYHNPNPELMMALGQLEFNYEEMDGALKVIGKNAHSANAPSGKNAIVGLFQALKQIGIESPAIRFVSDKLYQGVEGEKLFDKRSDDASGGMTVNLGMAEITSDKQVLGLDIRHPVTIPLDYFQEQLTKQAKDYGFILKDRDYLGPLYVDRSSELVQQLMQAYQEITGDLESQPEISGGATYARSMANFVAFGAGLPGSAETEHQPNERMTIQDMTIAYNIYQAAFKRLVMEEKE